MRILILAGLIGLGSMAQAGTEALPLTYEAFEVSVPHMDLENCPSGMDVANAFCRATLHHEEFHVFAFSYDDESPLVGFKTYSAEGLDALLK